MYWFSVTFKRDQQLYTLIKHSFGENFPGTVLGAFTSNNSLTPHGL